ncbi:carbohydrate sulfotransferase 5-like [Homarus americanus]|uniref:Carbohydrate sulfotransferase 5-like 1 n=1 Tax=Homarus americanus TaxID=6706 RepID=A0A8J5MPG5_HOMAM|nr:carbohydrate sulfotransferase 5-like [Homarus americanus]KAG7158914.1 Carbohydrate sulfotransferase 5-like 1 [Homarus americanus]
MATRLHRVRAPLAFIAVIFTSSALISRRVFHVTKSGAGVEVSLQDQPHTVKKGKVGGGSSAVEGEGAAASVTQVLILSSLPRSGSTLVAELLATHHNSVLFFEPLSNPQMKPCLLNGTCVKEYISSIFKCTYERNFENWLKGKGLFLKYFHSSVSRCFGRPKEGGGACRRKLDLRSLCQNASIRIVKVIRSRLSWLEGLLNDTSLKIKIIHLVRDPRGSLTSIKNLGWNSKPSIRCSALQDDMCRYNNLLKKYPAKLTRLRLERLSMDPYGTVSDIYAFLYDGATLSKVTLQFLMEHMSATDTQPSGDNMDTQKNSLKEYQSWRWKITSELLKETEKEPACRATITQLGHVLFGSLHNARNSSIALTAHYKTAKNFL